MFSQQSLIVALIYFATRKDSKTMTLADLITINYSPTSPLRFDDQGRTNAGNPKNSCDCNTRTRIIDIRHSVDNFYFSTALFGREKKKLWFSTNSTRETVFYASLFGFGWKPWRHRRHRVSWQEVTVLELASMKYLNI